MKIRVLPKPGNPQQGFLTAGSLVYPCALGRSGLVTQKHEGDGGTPRGTFRLLSGFYRHDREKKPRTILRVSPLHQRNGWCDEPDHPSYNRPVTLPFSASHEKMWRDDHLYDLGVILDCNISERIKGRGSAIFFHLAHSNYRPTEGCVAIARNHMRQILSMIGPDGADMTIG
ncbi:L,D-transpeptidase family protein [Coralliovum pocilloporae]|uniref:L,D-transpeptidase family protein n=1 Tax=Coralliovum pocilloporae TaxID=3066369 RepID=UPI00330765E5